jgi:hypothetical protein
MLSIRDPARQSIPCNGACNTGAGQNSYTACVSSFTNHSPPTPVRHHSQKTPAHINIFQFLKSLFCKKIHNQPKHLNSIFEPLWINIDLLKGLKTMLLYS